MSPSRFHCAQELRSTFVQELLTSLLAQRTIFSALLRVSWQRSEAQSSIGAE
jgi:hypothetical protein